ncbi:MAG: UDP-2,3-diacylglucosamine diphosphatase LpxI [Rhodospirillales bacterium]|nr:UDP-2,3-diacylglucosamine diphosphatase LpxI [Rhodospirillales bacterium]
MPPRLGILAGGGTLPALLVDTCIRQRRPFFVIAFEGQADAALVAARPDGQAVPHAWVRVGAAGRAVRLLRREGVRDLVMAGRMRRPSLVSLRPDLWALRFLLRHCGLKRGDDALLRALIEALGEEGFTVVGVDSLLPDLVAQAGVLGAVQPDAAALADVRLGVEAALSIGARDVGQAAVARRGRVIGREGREGTDAMLAACAGERPGTPSGVLVKMAKPGQERRVDLPAIGLGTIAAAARAGLAGIAVEAGGALLVERDGLIAAADAAGLFVIGVEATEGRP